MNLYSSKYDRSGRDHYTIIYYLPESLKRFIRKMFFVLEPPGPFVKFIGDEERERIVSKIVDLAMKEYAQDLYKTYGIRGFSSSRDYTKFLGDVGNERPIVSFNPRPYFKYGSHENEFITKSIKKHTRNLIKHPEQYFENPKDLEKFLYYCRWQRVNIERMVQDGVPEEILIRWEISVHNNLFPMVVRGYTDYFDGNVIYRIINSYMREIDLELYIIDLTAAEKLSPPEIDFSDSLALNFYYIDFSKLIVDFNGIKNFFYGVFRAMKKITIIDFNPYEFVAKYVEIVYLFFMKNIYPFTVNFIVNYIYPFIVNFIVDYIYFIASFGILGLVTWVGLMIFIARKYKFTYKDIKK